MHYQRLVGVSMGLDDGSDSETEYIDVGHYKHFVAVELYNGVDNEQNILIWDIMNVLWLSQWDFMMGQTVKQNINMGYYKHLVTVGCTLYGTDSETEYIIINMEH